MYKTIAITILFFRIQGYAYEFMYVFVNVFFNNFCVSRSFWSRSCYAIEYSNNRR